MSDPLSLNKILAGLLCACLILIGSGKLASFLQNFGEDTHNDHHNKDHGINEKISNSYPISVPLNSSNTDSLNPNTNTPIIPILALLTDANIEKGQKVSKKCAACHSFNEGGPNKVGPNLWNIVNREMASVKNFKYSNALNNFSNLFFPIPGISLNIDCNICLFRFCR